MRGSRSSGGWFVRAAEDWRGICEFGEWERAATWAGKIVGRE